jgi:hypothetical protein
MTYEDEPYWIYGTIGVILFRFWNKDKTYINLISVFAAGLIASQSLTSYTVIQNTEIIWAISSAGIFVFYSLRFKRKSEKQIIDYVKIGGVMLLTIYPIPFWILFRLVITPFWHLLLYATPFILASIFVYDRMILKPESMKKKFTIILLIQTVLIFALFIFAIIQKMEADRLAEEAERQRRNVENQQKLIHAMQVTMDEMKASAR